MALISWQFDTIVLDNVLLDNGSSVSFHLWLFNSKWVEISFRDKSIVAWNVSSCLGSSHSQFVMLIIHSCRVNCQFVLGVRTKCTMWLCVFRVEVSSLRAVSLTIFAPFRPCWFSCMFAELIIINSMIVRCPVWCWITEILASFLKWSSNYTTSFLSVVLCSSCESKELWFMIEFILDQCIRIFRWDFIITHPNRTSEFVSIVTSETLVILKAFGTISYLFGCMSVVISVKSGLSWFETRARLITMIQTTRLELSV